MSSAVDIDPTFKHALKLLHSSCSDSAEKIRALLDELIKQRFGSAKTLASTLTKKHLGEESLAPGSNLYVRKQKPVPIQVPVVPVTLPDSKQQSPAKSEPESAVPTPESLTVPPPPQSGPIILSLSDVEGNDEDDDVVMEEDQLKELEDLMCIVCRRMDVSARNRLVECADCHSLYHQECHKPAISEADANDQENAWFCTLCKGKSIGKSSSSGTSGSSSRKPETTTSSSSSSHSKSSSSKNYESSSSSSSSSKHKSSKSSSSREGSSQRSSERSDRDREKDKEKSSKSNSSSAAVGSSSSTASSASSSSVATAAGGSTASTSGGAGTPNINIISADKRLQMMKKKAAKLHDSKRKHK
uniref:Integrator complex subunit 12 n=1 Tax=Culex tarsalis TaxID=7177 RepID=A0A1Q3F1Y1_CULTA